MDTIPTPQFSPEQPIGQSPEANPLPTPAEIGAPAAAASDNAGQSAPPPILTAADVAAAMASIPPAAAPLPSNYTPAAAADQDVIEPEWVDLAEQVVAETSGNPYAEEEGIEALQIDYLKKRYGHEVKKPENG